MDDVGGRDTDDVTPRRASDCAGVRAATACESTKTAGKKTAGKKTKKSEGTNGDSTRDGRKSEDSRGFDIGLTSVRVG